MARTTKVFSFTAEPYYEDEIKKLIEMIQSECMDGVSITRAQAIRYAIKTTVERLEREKVGQ